MTAADRRAIHRVLTLDAEYVRGLMREATPADRPYFAGVLRTVLTSMALLAEVSRG
jgi:hypothetical protein